MGQAMTKKSYVLRQMAKAELSNVIYGKLIEPPVHNHYYLGGDVYALHFVLREDKHKFLPNSQRVGVAFIKVIDDEQSRESHRKEKVENYPAGTMVEFQYEWVEPRAYDIPNPGKGQKNPQYMNVFCHASEFKFDSSGAHDRVEARNKMRKYLMDMKKMKDGRSS